MKYNKYEINIGLLDAMWSMVRMSQTVKRCMEQEKVENL